MTYKCLYSLLFSIFYIGSTHLYSQNTLEEEPHTLHFSDSLIIADAQNYLETKIRPNESCSEPKTKDQSTNTPSLSATDPSLKTVEEELFTPFTGKVTGAKVRLRLQPNTNGPIIREVTPGEFWVITGETEEFYSVEPKSEMKGYIYRTYVLNGAIESSHVNVRLYPELQAPILAQLNEGDIVTLSPEQNYPKWVEVKIPDQVSFYIAKEYVKRVGSKSLYVELEQKRDGFVKLFKKIEDKSQFELKKPFEEIQLAPIVNELKTLETKSTDFPDIQSSIRNLIHLIQENYLELSVRAHTLSKKFEPISEYRPDNKHSSGKSIKYDSKTTFSLEQQELELVQTAITNGKAANEQDFYTQENSKSFQITGVLVPYERTVKNRPGDFILVDGNSKVPIAYVYSTKISLQNYLGEHITIQAAERPNHFFALPAYYVLQIGLDIPSKEK